MATSGPSFPSNAHLYKPSLQDVKAIAGKPENKDKLLVPVYRELMADLETPVAAYLKLRKGDYSFLLESVVLGEQRGRYSFIGTDPFKTLTVGEGHELTGDPLAHLAREMANYSTVVLPELPLPPFAGGAVGYVGYDSVRYFEKRTNENISKQEDPLKLPDSIYMFCDTLVIFDHVRNTYKIVSHCPLHESSLDESYKATIKKIDDVVARLATPLPVRDTDFQGDLFKPVTATEWESASNVGKEGYEAFVSDLRKHIVNGDIIQAVPSHRVAVKVPQGVAPFDFYRELRILNPSPYMYYLELGKDLQIVGASPEMLLKVDAEGYVHTHPIAGTRPRGKTPAEDAALAADLLADEKERAEHVMLVDLGRNDVGRVAMPGTVTVESLMNVEYYSHVMHIVSQVRGKLRPDLTPLDAFRAIFPAGTLTGAPKVMAMQLVAGLEPEKRGIYGGSVGYYSFSGVLDTAIAIRTMVIKDGIVYCQAGAGIVYDSDPATEYLETMNKLGAPLKAILSVAASRGIELSTVDRKTVS